MKKILTAFLPLFFLAFSIYSQHEIILHTDFEGNVVSGSKEELIKEIRKGKSVRVGYQLDFNEDKIPDFDHWVPAEFITILDGDVFTQIRNINLQIPMMEIPQIDIIPVNTMWTAVLSKNSKLKNRFVYEDIVPEYDENVQPIITEKIEKELKKREVLSWNVATFWAVEH